MDNKTESAPNAFQSLWSSPTSNHQHQRHSPDDNIMDTKRTDNIYEKESEGDCDGVDITTSTWTSNLPHRFMASILTQSNNDYYINNKCGSNNTSALSSSTQYFRNLTKSSFFDDNNEDDSSHDVVYDRVKNNKENPKRNNNNSLSHLIPSMLLDMTGRINGNAYCHITHTLIYACIYVSKNIIV